MERYIDLEAFEKRINKCVKPDDNDSHSEAALIEWCKDECIRQAYSMPRADVVPKSEVAREIFEAVLVVYKNTCDADFEEELAELKKKYTEDKEKCATQETIL